MRSDIGFKKTKSTKAEKISVLAIHGFYIYENAEFFNIRNRKLSNFFSESELSLRFSILVKGVIFTDFSFSSASLNEIESDVIFVMWTPATLKQAFFTVCRDLLFLQTTCHFHFSVQPIRIYLLQGFRDL